MKLKDGNFIIDKDKFSYAVHNSAMELTATGYT